MHFSIATFVLFCFALWDSSIFFFFFFYKENELWIYGGYYVSQLFL